MNTKSNQLEDDSLPYSVWKDPNGSIRYKNKVQRISLTREEAFQAAQLEQLVEQQSNFVKDYFLVRSSLSVNSTEKRAWNILYLLLRFVEAEGRFPTLRRLNDGVSELTEYLGKHLDCDVVLVNLPKMKIFQVRHLLGLDPVRPQFRPLDNFQLKELGSSVRATLRRYSSDILGNQVRQKTLNEQTVLTKSPSKSDTLTPQEVSHE